MGARLSRQLPFDGHIPSAVLEQASNLMQDITSNINVVVAGLGFRGVDAENPGKEIVHRGKLKSLAP